jgi:eukaryotic-like serine/threonine-protein kinase
MLEFQDPRELVGVVLDQRWRLARLIGEGGLGVVYEGQGSAGEQRAIKILRREFCDEKEIVDRFLSELKASARIEHPGVARIYEAVCAVDGTPYLVMDLVSGETLADRMNRGRVSVEQAAGIVVSILRALGPAHAVGVIHRDLKPGNIFVVGDPQSATEIRIVDFGIALVMDAAGGMQRKTRTGMLLGTPGYMSPEQIRSTKHADQRADLWSVGILFYELLTSRPAFEADNEFERITKVLGSPPTPIETIAPQYAHWGPFFARALAQSIEQRFQSAAEMAEAVISVARHGQLPRPSFEPAQAPQASHPPTLAAGAAPPARGSMPPHGSVPPPGAYGSTPPPAGAYGSTPPPAGGYGSIPPASPWMPAPDPNAPPHRFGTAATAISAGVPAPPAHDSAPRVEVVTPKLPGVRLPLALVLMLAAIALLIGFTVGFAVGRI